MMEAGVLPFRYETELCGEVLECELDFEPEEVGDRETPGYPATYSLQSVKVGGVEIVGLISDGLIREIEEAAYGYYEGGGYEGDSFESPQELW